MTYLHGLLCCSSTHEDWKERGGEIKMEVYAALEMDPGEHLQKKQ